MKKIGPPGSFLRNVAVLAGGTAFGQLVVMLASPLLARMYTPADFGVFGVYASLLTLLIVIVTLRYELAVPLPKEDEDSAALVVLCLLLIPVTVLATLGLLWMVGGALFRLIRAEVLEQYWWTLPLGMATAGIYQVFTYWAIRKCYFARISGTRMWQGIACVGIQLGAYKCGPLGLMLGQVASGAAGTFGLIRAALRQDSTAFSAVGRKLILHVSIRYRNFPLVSCVSGIINTAGLVVPILLISAFFDSGIAGQFALVQRVVALPVGVLGTAVSQVYFGAGAAARRSSYQDLRSLFLRTSGQLALAASIPTAIIVALGPWLFSTVFGSDWHVAGTYARILAPAVLLQLVAVPLSQTFNLLERQSWQLAWDVFRVVVVVSSICVPALQGASDVHAMETYSLATMFTYAVLWIAQLLGIGAFVESDGSK